MVLQSPTLNQYFRRRFMSRRTGPRRPYAGVAKAVAGWPSGRERNGLQPGHGTELGFPRPALREKDRSSLGEMQSVILGILVVLADNQSRSSAASQAPCCWMKFQRLPRVDEGVTMYLAKRASWEPGVGFTRRHELTGAASGLVWKSSREWESNGIASIRSRGPLAE